MNNRVRAVIVDGETIVLIRRIKAEREYWVFPGGGLEDSDASPQEGLKRECLEELGVEVEVGELFAELPPDPPATKQNEIFYVCRIVGGDLGTGHGPEFSRDPKQSGVYEIQRVPVSTLPDKSVQPTQVRDLVVRSFS